MRYLIRISLIFVILFPLFVVAAVFLALEDQPLVRRAAEFTPAHIERAKRIMEQNDPRKLAAGARHTVSLSQEELDLLLNYLANRFGRGSSRVVLQPGMATLTASVELPRSPLGRYLNVDTRLLDTGGLPVVDSVQIGRLSVPGWLADWLLEQGMRRLGESDDYRMVTDVIKEISVADGRLSVTYNWQAGLLERIKSVAVPQEDEERLKVYQARLASLGALAESPASVSLVEVMAPLFVLAQERSAAGDPLAENRAAIVVLAFYVNGRGLAAIVPAARNWPQPPRRKIVLDRRGDFPQHFTISAAISANAGGPLSDAIGLYKEVSDSRGGSGFSFNDIAADRAGTRFGELAAGSRASALKLQRQLAAGVRESDIMPVVKDLPEFMPEAEFKRRFGGIGAPAYQRMMDDIERRIAAVPFYR